MTESGSLGLLGGTWNFREVQEPKGYGVLQLLGGYRGCVGVGVSDPSGVVTPRILQGLGDTQAPGGTETPRDARGYQATPRAS